LRVGVDCQGDFDVGVAKLEFVRGLLGE